MTADARADGRVAVTGSGGFLGWHTRAALRQSGVAAESFKVGDGFELEAAARAISGVPRLIHIAGINRGGEDEVRAGNVVFAEQVAQALRRASVPPSVLVYANSTQANNASVYGDAKARAGDILAGAAEAAGVEFVDLRLPNLFGEHGRPFYNAVTATFCHLLSEGREPTVEDDKELTLLHAQNAADLLTGAVEPQGQAALQVTETVSGLLRRLTYYRACYLRGEIPNIADHFDRDLFNTYRSYVVNAQTPIRLSRHADARGSFFEVIRSHGGPGQSSFSTTAPGVSRGDHYHRRKVERFTVLSGRARISLRRLFTDQVLHLDVDGEHPVAIDMPTMWAHRITNTGTEGLFTSFWTNDLFDAAHPDTIGEVV